jgi:rhodanese-related sulfurtransferase
MKIKERSSLTRLFWGVCLGILAWLGLAPGSGKAMTSVNNQQRHKAVQELYANYKKCFPEIPEVTPEETMKLLQEEQAVVLDVRPAVERLVSKLPGAIAASEFLQCPDRYAGKTLIAYDTVGYRSGLFVDKLRKQGIGISNLQGGLLGWLHAGGKLYDANGCETRRVHVYGCMWNYAPFGFETLR